MIAPTDLAIWIAGARGVISRATPGPYFYNSYNAIFSKPLVEADNDDPIVVVVPPKYGDTARRPDDAVLVELALNSFTILLDAIEAAAELREASKAYTASVFDFTEPPLVNNAAALKRLEAAETTLDSTLAQLKEVEQ